MNYLFLDTTSNLKLGLLDEEFNWLSYQKFNSDKPSEIIHSKIYHLLQTHKVDLLKTSLIYIAGPGSYTGMRLSEGIVETFNLNNILVYGMYQYQIPQFSGVKKGKWACNAFKSQYFIYEWDQDNAKTILVNKDKFDFSEIYYFSDDGLNLSGENVESFLNKNSNMIFKKLTTNNNKIKPYYFRDLEMEFVPSC